MKTLKLSVSQSLLCDILADTHRDSRVRAANALRLALGDEATFALAQANDVVPILTHVVLHDLEADDVPAHWHEAYAQTHDRITAYMTELDHVAARLAEVGIPLIALKNVGIARGIYSCPGCCPMGDQDVLVEKRHFRRAHQILLAEGYHFEFRSPLEEAEISAAEKGGGTEYWKTLANGEKMWFELQWRPVAGRWIRPDQEPAAEELMARSIAIPGTAVRLLAPEDNLLQVALHTAKHSYVRAPGFRLHMDVDRIVRRQPIDWEVFLNRVLALEVQTAVYFSLAFPKVFFETPIPVEVLTQLQPAVWKDRLISRWLQRVGLFNPDAPKFGRLGYILFTSLLYDDLMGLWQGIFPSRAWMYERYGFDNDLLLPYYHTRRLADLTFRRVSS